jgi:hypothetical protein
MEILQIIIPLKPAELAKIAPISAVSLNVTVSGSNHLAREEYHSA